MRLTRTITLRTFAILALVSLGIHCKAQSDEGTSDSPSYKRSKGFHFGLDLGSYFANNYTASAYDGYGFDINGGRNEFTNSLMYRRIVEDYGGGHGQQDYIAQALSVNHDDWSFNEDNMPVNMTYSAAIQVGLHAIYNITREGGVMLNIKAAQISVNGNFTININNPPIGSQTPGYSNYRIFDIKGKEQRLMFQLGYQKILGATDNMNFFYEGGGICTLTKFTSEQIKINSLLINLTDYFNLPGYYVPAPQNRVGIGIGMFAGFGINIPTSTKWSAQLLYSPSYENLFFGSTSKFTLQNALNIRFIR